jgi:cytochrome c oxidase assembly factor CtaG
MVTAMLLTLYVAPVLLVFGGLAAIAEWMEGGE